MGSIHPIENRYNTKEMKRLFTEEYKLDRWLDVEVALAKAQATLGIIDEKTADEIALKVSMNVVKLDRVQEIEDKIHHDVMAMVKGLAEQCDGDAGGFIHLGATSYDIVDTAWAMMMRDAIEIVEKRIKDVMGILAGLATKHKHLACIGRTHGQHAIPTTYGMNSPIGLTSSGDTWNDCICSRK